MTDAEAAAGLRSSFMPSRAIDSADDDTDVVEAEVVEGESHEAEWTQSEPVEVADSASDPILNGETREAGQPSEEVTVPEIVVESGSVSEDSGEDVADVEDIAEDDDDRWILADEDKVDASEHDLEHSVEHDVQREFEAGDEVSEAQSPAEVAELEATQPASEVRANVPPPARIQSLPMAKALNAGLRQAMADNPKVILMGEDIGALGGVFRVTEGLKAEFGNKRVLDTPLAESGIIGTAIGLAMRGYRPVCEIQFDGFIFPGFDQITSQLAKITNRHEGALQMPVVIRVPYGGHIGAIEHHQESPEAYFAHTPGLRVVSPSTPNDAYWMIQEAIASNDPVMFFEPKSRYWPKGEIDFFESAVPLHSTRIVRSGTDATLIGYGAMVSVLLRAAELAAEEGTSLEVVDLRSISPIDYDPILESVRKTGRLIVAQEAPGFVSVGSEIAATVSEKAFYSLEAPVIRVASFDTPFPPSKVEEFYLPDADRVLEAVDRSLAY